MKEPVRIYHPDLPGTAPALVERRAFDEVWSGKGFLLVDEPKPEPKKPARKKATKK